MAQVWLVTGSSRGLGRAIVEAGLAAGNKVLATARGIESLADLPERYGDQVKLFALDVADEAAAANAVMSAIDLFGSLDVVINNAGYGNLSSIEDTPLSEFPFSFANGCASLLLWRSPGCSRPVFRRCASIRRNGFHYARDGGLPPYIVRTPACHARGRAFRVPSLPPEFTSPTPGALFRAR